MKYKNNPLNIRYSPKNNWLGQCDSKNGFCQFNTLYYGCRASIKLLHNYTVHGCNTIGQIISRFAPQNENNTSAYISAVCGFLGCSADYVVKDKDLPKLAFAMSRVEQGKYDLDLLIPLVISFDNLSFCYVDYEKE